MKDKRGLLVAALTVLAVLASGCASYYAYPYHHDYWAPYYPYGGYGYPCY